MKGKTVSRRYRVACAAWLGSLLLSCAPTGVSYQVDYASGPQEMRHNPLLYGFNEIIPFGDLKEGDISQAADSALGNAKNLLQKIIETEDEKRTFENTMLPLDDLTAIINGVWSPAYLMGAVHPDEKIRREADSSHVRFSRFMNELSSNEDLYHAVVAYSETDEARNLLGERKKFLEDRLRDFRRSGFGLGKKKREQVKEINNKLSDIGLQFNRNIALYQDTLFVTEAGIEGLPDTYRNQRLQPDGTYAVDMSYPSYFPFMKFSKSDDARERLSYKFLNRAKDKNLNVLDDMLRYRRRLVEVLGYKTYAEYRTEDRMAKTPEAVWTFENDLRRAVRKKAEQDYREMLEAKSEETGNEATVIQPWEKWYYDNKLLMNKYQVDEEEVKQYFELNHVINGMFSLYELLFDLRFVELDSPSVWHEDVRMFEVFDRTDGRRIGLFYLDLFPRANKYQHAAAFDIVRGKQYRRGHQRPVYSLVVNFPKPSESEPSLLPHGDVETFFHEFGHLLHGLLNSSELVSTEVPWDFVEAPSQMLENLVWKKQSLKLFAKHYKTEEPIPDELVDRMVAARNLNSGTKALQQIYYGILDFTLHDGFDPGEGMSTTDLVRELQNRITLYPYQEDTHFQAAFGHLNHYAAAYYGYMWSRVYAQDMFSVFEENGILDKDTGLRYRHLILEKGGTEDPLDMVTEFLGREPDNKAFLRSLGL